MIRSNVEFYKFNIVFGRLGHSHNWFPKTRVYFFAFFFSIRERPRGETRTDTSGVVSGIYRQVPWTKGAAYEEKNRMNTIYTKQIQQINPKKNEVPNAWSQYDARGLEWVVKSSFFFCSLAKYCTHSEWRCFVLACTFVWFVLVWYYCCCAYKANIYYGVYRVCLCFGNRHPLSELARDSREREREDNRSFFVHTRTYQVP